MTGRPSAVLSVPTPALAAALSGLDGATVVEWDMVAPAPRDDIRMVVPPYMSSPSLLGALAGRSVELVQSQSIGYDGVAEYLPAGATFCNAAGVHEASTGELALALILASLRGLQPLLEAQVRGDWRHGRFDALADKRVLVIGTGGVGRAVVSRLEPFEVTIDRVATSARTDERGAVHGRDELAALIPLADVVVLAVPLAPATAGLVDAGFLAAMKHGALLVNVSRGGVVVTDALVDAVRDGRVRAALDVTDPEPLPSGHPLWTLPGVIITPHVGGDSTAMFPRVERLVREQWVRLVNGETLANVVIAPGQGT